MTTDIRSGAITPARRTESIHYAVRDILLVAEDARKAGRDLLYLNIGDPNLFDFAPAPHVLAATIDAMQRNLNGYAPSEGVGVALEAVRADAKRLGIRDIQHVFITTGASEAIDIALTALVNGGENVLTPSPGYPLYPAILSKIEAENRTYRLDESNGWQPDVADIERQIDDKTRAIVLINPNNPTGSVASRETVQAVVDLAHRHNLVLFSDEIYDRLLYDGGQHVPSASLSRDAKIITFNGMSKAHVVPGFRLGWGIVSGPGDELEDYCEAMAKIERARLSANHAEQYAIPTALTDGKEHLAEMMGRLTRRRNITVERLNAIDGISCVAPAGAFYAFPRLECGVDDKQFCAEVIRDTGVVIVPGSGFGQEPGTQHFRVVFLPPDDVLERAFDGIAMVAARYSAGHTG